VRHSKFSVPMSASGQKQTLRSEIAMSALPPIVLQNSDGFTNRVSSVFFCRALFRCADERVAASPHWYQRLTHQLCWTGRRQWRWTAKKLDEPPQVLRGCGEQDLVPRAGQASQSKPVEPEDTLHMRKSHLDLLALAV